MKRVPSITTTIFLSSLAFSMTAFATERTNDNGIVEKNIKQYNVDQYWTAERLKNAKAVPMPSVDLESKDVPITQLTQDIDDNGDGALPVDGVAITPQRLFYPNNESNRNDSSMDTPLPGDRGSLNYDFSSSQLVPPTADTSYPHRAVGKLFFTKPGVGDFVCSASVLRPRLVVTAGHCVHKGANGADGFYTNFLFIPAYNNGTAPYLQWSPTYVATTNTWASGGNTVPNAADYAMFQMQDANIDGVVRTIGSITGYLGYQTAALTPNHAHIFGYPVAFDGGNLMHQVTSQSARTVSPNCAEYGSDMTGGSSGGPVIQNFGSQSTGQAGGNNSGRNRLIGVVSYIYTSGTPMVEGMSIFDSRFINLLNTLCSHSVGNCP